MKQVVTSFFLSGLILLAQPDLLTQPPTVIARCAPQYTASARRARLEGTVVLYIEVYPDGTAHGIRVQRGLGLGLDEKAIEAVRQWRFSAGINYGRPAVVAVTVEVHFGLSDTIEPCRAGPPPTQAKPPSDRV